MLRLTAVVSFVLIIVLSHGCERTPFGREGADNRAEQRTSSIAPLSPYGFPLALSSVELVSTRPLPLTPTNLWRLNVVLRIRFTRNEVRLVALVPYALRLLKQRTLVLLIATYLVRRFPIEARESGKSMRYFPIRARKKKESIRGEQCDNWEEKPYVGEKSKRIGY